MLSYAFSRSRLKSPYCVKPVVVDARAGSAGCHSVDVATEAIPKLKTGPHGRCTKREAIEIVQPMASTYSDGEIAFTLNRLSLKTRYCNYWSGQLLRSHLHLCAESWGALSIGNG